ncbi:hypothetical protein B0G69_8071 [Paraburkholderia sp. RAU2J]|uniref:hypothetical protein n=1 Tax=Paraburkholderia sp. RAU2J TaxID=1938810 RepID=UPI000EADEE50|nr:hypothetical protein [Paraburkholderia sp. RAU2J]RKT10638.1 hypothetical protein B0G69_8071 [Paraburkholderia sp. RAU2J]
MPNAVTLFARVIADVFTGKPPAQPSQTAAAPNTQQEAPAAPAVKPAHAEVPSVTSHVVGQGASNETVMTIGDIPHLFVDEGDHVVQFTPAFDDHAEETEFGLKIVPDLEPHWSRVAIHRCPLKTAIATAIRQGANAVMSGAVKATPEVSDDGPPSLPETEKERFDADDVSPVRQRREQSVDASTVVGRIASWGEEQFPDRKKPGRFYKSFAIHIDTASGERTLQGEGLKEAIAECRCVVGDVVSIRRLRKVKVPAIRADGSAMLKDGKPVMWDKWLWSITK